jgi:light-independent protochlorophyllide reductase subunit B
MFREDFEFANGAGPSHLGGGKAATAAEPEAPAATPAVAAGPADAAPAAPPAAAPALVAAPALTPAAQAVASPAAAAAPVAAAPAPAPSAPGFPVWTPEAERELKKIPFFVRGKARRNTERFAQDRGLDFITLETLYDAKAHFGR